MFAGNFAPAGWAFCEGQEIPISENSTLFTLIGTAYGGNGQDTFGLPDLRGRVPMHAGDGFSGTQASEGGVESVTLTVQQIPSHTHPLVASGEGGTLPDPANHVLARSSTAGVFLYNSNEAPDVTLAANSVSPAGGSQPHENLQPYLAVNFIISLFGIFPSAT